MLTPGVEKAIADLRFNFPDIRYAEDGSGGAFVLIDNVTLGPPFTQGSTWVGFSIASTCPYADTYPHYFRHDLSRCDGTALAPPIYPDGYRFPPAGKFKDENGAFDSAAVMVSRRSNHRDSLGVETPLTKLNKVLRWMRNS